MVAVVERQNQGRGARGEARARGRGHAGRDAARGLRADQYLASPRQRRARPSASRTTAPRPPPCPSCPLLAYLIHAVSGMRAFSC